MSEVLEQIKKGEFFGAYHTAQEIWIDQGAEKCDKLSKEVLAIGWFDDYFISAGLDVYFFSPEADSFSILKEICVKTDQKEYLKIFDEYEAMLAEPPLSSDFLKRQDQINEARDRLDDEYWDKTQELDLRYDDIEPILSHVFIKHSISTFKLWLRTHSTWFLQRSRG